MSQSFFYAVRRWYGYIRHKMPWHTQLLGCYMVWSIDFVHIDLETATDWTICTVYQEAV